MRKICGVGINDADYPVTPRVNGKQVWCPFYRVWVEMLRRSYSSKKYRTYEDCKVVEVWHLFSNFKSWMETQDWQGNELDKDLLVKGNKIYGPDTCIFVPKEVNMFITNDRKRMNGLPVGISLHKASLKYRASCGHHNGGSKHIGLYSTVEEAVFAYTEYKYSLAKTLATQQTDERIAQAILKRYTTENVDTEGE